MLDATIIAASLVLLLDRELVGMTGPSLAGRVWWTLPLFALCDLALLWRRSHPVPVAITVFVAYGVHALVTGGGVEGVFVVLPGYVALYSLGAYATGRRLLVGVVGVAALNALHDTHDPGVHLSDQVEVWSYLFFSSLAVGVLVVGVLVGTRRRAVDAHRRAIEGDVRRAEAVASERAKIARELHDVVTHNVNVVVMQAMAAHGVLDSDPGRARAPLEAIEASGREALAEMRRMLGVLREENEPLLAPQPGVIDVRRLVGQARAAGQSVDLVEQGDLEGIPDGLGLVVYRIVQEGLTNAMKHAAGAPVRVVVSRSATQVDVEVSNPAGRSEPEATGAGHGLIGMAERAGLFGGSVTAGPTLDRGFRVTAGIPLGPA
jgi:signal transduction histidine kinase